MSNPAQYGFDPYASDTGWFGGTLYRKAKKAVKSVAKVPGISLFTNQVNVVSDIARGKNVVGSFRRAGGRIVADGRRSLPIAASVASFVPGVGTAVGAGLNAASALSQGKSVGDILLAAGQGALPGGPLVSAAVKAVGTGVKGGSLLAIGEAAARGVVPQNIQSAVSFGSDVLRGKNVIKSALANGVTQFLPNTPELKGFNTAKAILTSGAPSVGQLARARAALRTEGARRAFDSAVGAASKAASSGVAASVLRQAALPRQLVRMTRGTATAAFRPLSPRAAQVIAARAPAATLAALFGRRETAGLEPDGASYRVEQGDSAWAIAKRIVKDGNRWRELVKANPQKKTNPKDGNFATLFAGEILQLPQGWRQQVAPALKADVLSQARALLKVWSESDGTSQAGVTDYGSKTEDGSLTWGPRDRLMLVSFANWRNMTLGKRLSVVGDLSTALADELRLWASEHANAKAPQSPATQSTEPTPPTPASAATVEATSPGWPSVAPVEAQPVPPAPVVYTSAASTTPAATPKGTPFADLSAMAAAAQASGDLATMRRVANELAKQYPGQSSGSEIQRYIDQLNTAADKAEAGAWKVPDPTVQLPTMKVTGTVQAKAAAPAQSSGGDFGPLLIAGVVIAKLAHVI